MKILIVEPWKQPRVAEINGTLESMQQVVGGHIQAIYPFDDPVTLICDEEGLFKDYECSRVVGSQPIMGTFFICGTGSDDFTNLSSDLLEKYQQHFRLIEISRHEYQQIPDGYRSTYSDLQGNYPELKGRRCSFLPGFGTTLFIEGLHYIVI